MSDTSLVLVFVLGIGTIWTLICLASRARGRAARRRRYASAVARPEALRVEDGGPRIPVDAGGAERLDDRNLPRPQRWGEARRLSAAGWEASRIAQRLGLGEDEVRIVLKMGRLETEREATAAERYRRMQELSDQGMSSAEIGARLRMGEQEVELFLRLKGGASG